MTEKKGAWGGGGGGRGEDLVTGLNLKIDQGSWGWIPLVPQGHLIRGVGAGFHLFPKVINDFALPECLFHLVTSLAVLLNFHTM